MVARVSSARRGQLLDLLAGALRRATVHCALLGVDRLEPVGAGAGLALQPVMAGARFGIGRALAVHRIAQLR